MNGITRYAQPRERPAPPRIYETIPSTRADPNDEDAHRDFDGFNVNEELEQARCAVEVALNTAKAKTRAGKLTHLEALRAACAMFDNIDEWLLRGGHLPKDWKEKKKKKPPRRARKKSKTKTAGRSRK